MEVLPALLVYHVYFHWIWLRHVYKINKLVQMEKKCTSQCKYIYRTYTFYAFPYYIFTISNNAEDLIFPIRKSLNNFNNTLCISIISSKCIYNFSPYVCK